MGICCIFQKTTKDSNDFNHNQRIADIYLFNKKTPPLQDKMPKLISYPPANSDQVQEKKSILNSKLFQKSNKRFQSQEDSYRFFTYWKFSEEIYEIIQRYIAEKSSHMLKSQRNNQVTIQLESNKKFISGSDKKARIPDKLQQKSQPNDKSTQLSISFSVQELQFYIEEAKQYLQCLGKFIKGQFMSEIERVFSQNYQQVDKQTFKKKINDFIMKAKKQDRFKMSNELQQLQYLLRTDILLSLVIQLNPESRIPCKIKFAVEQSNLHSELQKISKREDIFCETVNNQQKFYLVKMELYSLINLLLGSSKQESRNKIQNIIITISQINSQSPNISQQFSKQYIQINAKKISNTSSIFPRHRFLLIITPNTVLNFQTKPLNSAFTLHATQFLKFSFINQIFNFTQSAAKVIHCAKIGVKMQIFSSNWSESLQKLKIHTKNIINYLQIIKKGENTWQNLDTLGSSCGSVSQNQSSFVSHYEIKNFC